METKTIEKVKLLVDRLKDIDNNINTLNKLANDCLTEKCKTSIVLNCEKPKKEKAEIDIDGYSIFQGMLSKYSMSYEDNEQLGVSFKLSDINFLEIIGLLLCNKKQERDSILLQLSKLGLKTN